MNNMKWSTDKPKVPGWYWWRADTCPEEICRVYPGDAESGMFARGIIWDEEFDIESLSICAEWAGPISSPDECEPSVQ